MINLLHTCDVARKVPVGTNGRMQSQALYSDVPALFLPLLKPISLELQFTLGRDYNAFFNVDQDVVVGDQLTWDSRTFNVRTVSTFDVPAVGHKECLVTEESV